MRISIPLRATRLWAGAAVVVTGIVLGVGLVAAPAAFAQAQQAEPATASASPSSPSTVWTLPTRDGVRTTVYREVAPNAWATVLLFLGGAGGFGKLEQGRPSSNNFLVRTATALHTSAWMGSTSNRLSSVPNAVAAMIRP